MVPDIACLESLSWIRVQNLCDKIATVVSDELRDGVVGIQDLLVEDVRLGVLKWQIAADHGVEDDSAGPDVSWQSVVVFAGDHLGCGIARTPTCRL